MGGPGCEKAAEGEAGVCSEAPHVDIVQRSKLFVAGHHAIDGSHRVRVIKGLDQSGNSAHPAQRLGKREVGIEHVVVPLVPNHPHEDGGVVLQRTNGLHNALRLGATGDVHRVQDIYAFAPQYIQNIGVGDGLVGAHGVDPCSGHQLTVRLDETSEVKTISLPAPFGNGVPVHTLQEDGFPTDQYLPPPDADGRSMSKSQRAKRHQGGAPESWRSWLPWIQCR
mmetsp:Transcript_63771/g.190033  ORF Transcript_63771/g.190033 Transcript_63771/m.190033 type:complete len:223 (-) Transcript_63771:76-744(-)